MRFYLFFVLGLVFLLVLDLIVFTWFCFLAIYSGTKASKQYLDYCLWKGEISKDATNNAIKELKKEMLDTLKKEMLDTLKKEMLDTLKK